MEKNGGKCDRIEVTRMRAIVYGASALLDGCRVNDCRLRGPRTQKARPSVCVCQPTAQPSALILCRVRQERKRGGQRRGARKERGHRAEGRGE